MKQSKMEEWKEKLSKDGLYLKRIRRGQTPELCEIAIKQNPWAIEFVNEPTLELCQLATDLQPLTIISIRCTDKIRNWFISKVCENIRIVPRLRSQLEILQWEFLRSCPEESQDLYPINLRLALEKAKWGMGLEFADYKNDFEVLYAVESFINNYWWGAEILHLTLPDDIKRELLLMSGRIDLISGIEKEERKKLEAEQTELRQTFRWSYYDNAFNPVSGGPSFSSISIIENQPVGLSLITGNRKTYRLCRHATRLHQKAKWFSPYHALELLMKDGDY